MSEDNKSKSVAEKNAVDRAEEDAVTKDKAAAQEAIVKAAAVKAIVAKKKAVAKEIATKATLAKTLPSKKTVAEQKKIAGDAVVGKLGTAGKGPALGKGMDVSGLSVSDDVPELIEKVIKINRVAKVVKGGRRFSFNALVVVGDGQGKVGSALGKANEITDAVRKGVQKASHNMRKVAIHGRTVPHAVRASFGASRVVIKPCQPGRGIISSGVLRAVVEAVGIHDISVKTLGSNNPYNSVKAALGALYELKTFKEIAERRGFSEDRLRQSAKTSAT